MIVDAHQHYWHYTPAEYGWIDEKMAAIRRDFLPADLELELEVAGVDAAVAVQARQTLAETRWLLDLAGRHAHIAGVVGWVPLAEPGVDRILTELAANSALKGVRHVVQGEPPGFLDDPAFNAGIRTLAPLRLVYDILIVACQLEEAIRFVDRHTAQSFVLDHIAKPPIREGRRQPWESLIRELARRPNVACKLSGMVTEADYHHWTPAQLRPYAEVVIEAFGPARVMAGSDWPVCRVACSYTRWFDCLREWTAPLTDRDRRQIFGLTACDVYRIAPPASS